MTLSTIYQLYRGGHFIGGGNRSTWGKETNKVCIIKKVILLPKLCVTVILIQLIMENVRTCVYITRDILET
jgi:hypothetical protein